MVHLVVRFWDLLTRLYSVIPCQWEYDRISSTRGEGGWGSLQASHKGTKGYLYQDAKSEQRVTTC